MGNMTAIEITGEGKWTFSSRLPSIAGAMLTKCLLSILMEVKRIRFCRIDASFCTCDSPFLCLIFHRR